MLIAEVPVGQLSLLAVRAKPARAKRIKVAGSGMIEKLSKSTSINPWVIELLPALADIPTR